MTTCTSCKRFPVLKGHPSLCYDCCMADMAHAQIMYSKRQIRLHGSRLRAARRGRRVLKRGYGKLALGGFALMGVRP